MAAVEFFLALIRAGVETASATINDNNEIDLFSKVDGGSVPGLCVLNFFGETKKEEPHDLVGGVIVRCPTEGGGLDYFELYSLANLDDGGTNPISDPHIGDFTISFSGSNPSVQEPLKSNALLDSPWYYTRSGPDTFTRVPLENLAMNPILMDNCAGDPVDVVIGDLAFSSTESYADEQILYNVVVPAIGAEAQCPG